MLQRNWSSCDFVYRRRHRGEFQIVLASTFHCRHAQWHSSGFCPSVRILQWVLIRRYMWHWYLLVLRATLRSVSSGLLRDYRQISPHNKASSLSHPIHTQSRKTSSCTCAVSCGNYDFAAPHWIFPAVLFNLWNMSQLCSCLWQHRTVSTHFPLYLVPNSHPRNNSHKHSCICYCD